jgi:DNA-binding transcriptional ArsR family regulator
MGFSKADAFPMDQQMLAICGKLISHPARIQIIQYLIRNGSSCMQEIADSIPLNRRSVTQHLTKLRSHGLLTVTEKTPYVFYEIDERALLDLVKHLKNFFIDRLEATI